MTVKKSSTKKLMRGADGKMHDVPIMEYRVHNSYVEKDGSVRVQYELGNSHTPKSYTIAAERIDDVINHLDETTKENYDKGKYYSDEYPNTSLRNYVGDLLFEQDIENESQLLYCKEQIYNLALQDIREMTTAIGLHDIHHQEKIKKLTMEYEKTLMSISD